MPSPTHDVGEAPPMDSDKPQSNADWWDKETKKKMAVTGKRHTKKNPKYNSPDDDEPPQQAYKKQKTAPKPHKSKNPPFLFLTCCARIKTNLAAISNSRMRFLSLPNNDIYCKSVDTQRGLWVDCKSCNKRVFTKAGESFTVGRWNLHLRTLEHSTKVTYFLSI